MLVDGAWFSTWLSVRHILQQVEKICGMCFYVGVTYTLASAVVARDFKWISDLIKMFTEADLILLNSPKNTTVKRLQKMIDSQKP